MSSIVRETQHNIISRELNSLVTKNFSNTETLKHKLLRIFEEDKKLDYPVFLFIKPEAISKLLYFLSGRVIRPVSIGIAGETASGKSTFTLDFIESLETAGKKFHNDSIITRINTDDYYYDRSDRVKEAGSFVEFAKNYDFDVPEAFELDLLKHHIGMLCSGRPVTLPKYDMSGTAIRYDNHTPALPRPVVISEGLFNLTDTMKEAFDFCLYVQVSNKAQKERFFRRAAERGLGDAAARIYKNALSKAEIYVQPSSKNADIIINGESSRHDYRNTVNKLINLYQKPFVKL